ncbi:hypothetical protein [Rheinheimera riviphila]|nr:hypothetical protein [Rheinheimera riviphila]
MLFGIFGLAANGWLEERFACGEFLSFASPKERNQRKGDPGSLESPQ